MLPRPVYGYDVPSPISRPVGGHRFMEGACTYGHYMGSDKKRPVNSPLWANSRSCYTGDLT